VWIIYALLTAFLFATSDALTKRALASRDEYFVAWIRLLFALPALVVSFAFIDIPRLDKTFWFATLIALPLEILAIVLYTKALKISPITLTMPFLSLTPLFLIITAYFILDERVSLWGSIGIFFIAGGSYTLNLHKVRLDLLGPIRAIVKERGSLLIIIVAFIFSFTSTLGKMAIDHSSPVFFGSFYFILVTLLFTPIAITKNRGRIVITKNDIGPLASIGITYALMIIFHMLALSMTEVAYMISVKRLSLLFSVMYGYLLFREKRIVERTIGSSLMLTGFVLIILMG
jgi:drug/metabolite transporter (DMT)-like permease